MIALAEIPTPSIRVLLVEDDTIDQLAFTRCVKQSSLPYDYTIAGSLEEAKAILAERSFDVAILDFYLGDGNSLELVEQVKSKHLPFIVATGSGDEETAVQMMQWGAHDYLIKDPDRHYLKVLASTVTKAIARKQSEDQIRLLTQAMQGIRDGIYIVDAEGTLTFINNALSEICGISRNAALGKPIQCLQQAELTRHVAQTVNDAEALCSQELELVLTRTDGSTFIASLSESLIHDGTRSLKVGVIRDITPIKRVEIELRLSQDSLEQMVKQRTQELQQTNRELQSEIQERLKVEESLRSSRDLIQQQQKFLHSVIDSNPNLIFVKDWDGCYQLINQAMAAFYGMTVDDLIGKRDADANSNAEDVARFLSENRQVITTQQPMFLPEEKIVFQGREHWLQWQKCPIRLPGSDILGVLGVGVNITSRKQSELSLQASEKRFASLAEAAPVGIFRTDASGNCVYVNAHWCHIAGLSPEEASGQGWTQALHPDDRDRIASEWYQSAQENRPFKLEYRFRRADGTIVWVFGQSSAEQNSDGLVVGYIGTIIDISDRKRSEDALRASEAYQRALIRSLPDLLMRLDLDGRYLEFIAPPTFRVIGDADGMIGSSIHDNLPADVAQVRMDLVRRAIQTGTIQFYEQDLSSNGKVQIEEVRVVPCGEREALLLVRDISDRKQAELTLQKVVTGTAAVTGEDFFPVLVQHIAEALDVCYVLVAEKVGEELHSLGFWAHGALQPPIAYLPARTPCECTLRDGEFHCETLVQRLFPDDADLVTMRADSYLGIALKDSRGESIGNLCILDVEPLSQAKRAASIPILQVFAARAAAEVQRKAATLALHQLNQDLEARVEQRTLELQAREGQLRDLFDNATDLIQSIDFEGRILFVNAAWKRTLGYSDADLAALSIFEIIHPDDLEHCQIIMQRLFDGEHCLGLETRFLTKSGQEIRVEGNVNCQLKDGRPVATRGIFRDITERKRAEQQLRASEKRYATLAAMAPVGIFRADAQGNCVYVNERWCEIAGLSPVEAVGMGWIRALYPPDRQRYRAEWQRISQSGEAFNLEYRFQRPGGDVVWVFGQAVQERDLDGVVSGYVVTVTDISDRKRDEEAIALQLRRQQTLGAITQKIRKSLNIDDILTTVTQQVKTLMQADRVIVFQLLADGTSRIVEESVSPELPRLKARHWDDEIWSPEILEHYWQGQPRIVPDAMDDRWTDCLVEYSREGQIQSKIVAPILKEAFVDETSRWIDGTQSNKLWGILVVHACHHKRVWEESEAQLLQQIANQVAIAIKQANLFEQIQQELEVRQQTETRLTESNRQLAISNEQLMRATQLKDEFLANMSHELRTPLNAILGMTEGMQDGVFGIINAQQERALQTVERSGTHLLELINDILDLSKIESEHVELDRAPTAIAPLCQASLVFVRQQAMKKGLQIQVDVCPALPKLFIDERRIRQVLINLLNNAVKFTPSGAITLSVALERSPHDTTPHDTMLHDTFPHDTPLQANVPMQVRFTVSDTGIGISPEDIKRLFQPFIQVDSALNRQYQGTGLGLALVKRIVELHGGDVSVTSAIGVGSQFMFTLPCLDGEQYLL